MIHIEYFRGVQKSLLGTKSLSTKLVKALVDHIKVSPVTIVAPDKFEPL